MTAWTWAMEQRLLRFGRAIRSRVSGPKTVYVTARRDEYRGYWEAAAAALGAELVALTEEVWEIRRNGRVTRVSSWVTQCDDPVTLRLAGDKSYTHRLAQAASVPVPRHVTIRGSDLAPARRLIDQIGRPVVVKPLRGSASGMGITTHVRNAAALRRAVLLASLYGDEILIEEMIPAESCRFLYLDGRLLHAVRRRGVRVSGDGVRSIGQLLVAAGIADPASDGAVTETLAHQGRGLDQVPGKGEVVVARNLPLGHHDFEELRTVYDEDITPLVAPTLAEELGRVVRALGSEFAGVDVLTNDPSRTLGGSGGTFLEINTTPGLHHHYVSVTDPSRGPAVAVLAYLLDHQATSASPSGGGADSPTGRADV